MNSKFNLEFLDDYLDESIRIAHFQKTLKNELLRVSEKINEALMSGNKIMFCGNGGSASDSQHAAAEFVGRFKLDRKPMAAIALTTDTSIITSVGNDYGYDQVFSKQVEALGKPGDYLVGITTSGKSKNIISALSYAKKNKINTVALTGDNIEDIKDFADLIISIPSKETGVVQQAHITVLQLVAGLIEEIQN